ncbi:hypothetical protein ACFO9Q_08515 [Paenibacillus sp. GCM10023252]|uniref:hypothetical protein n=1 Tax=Paenibacillus sp. GCM10023252 TaxID=3252649 RepID=UPI00361E6853
MNRLTIRRKSKTTAASVILLTLMLTAAGCGGSADNGNRQLGSGGNAAVTENGNEAEVTPEVSEAPTDIGVVDTGTAEPEASKEPSEPVETVTKYLHGEGKYTGQIDSHSVEIETDKGIVAYQIEEELQKDIDALGESAQVEFQYVEKEVQGDSGVIKQPWLTQIKEVK